MRILTVAALVVLSVSPGAFAAGNTAAGKATFKQRCAVCHGDDASGDTPMAKAFNADMNLHDQKAQSLKDSDIADIIRNGRGKMPKPPGVIEQEIPNLIAYIRSLATKKT